MIDPNEAPEGYKAIHGESGCLGCCFLSGGCLGCARMHCAGEYRKDGCEAVFVAGSATPKPTVKLPQRYEDIIEDNGDGDDCAVMSWDNDGTWLKYEDVIAALKAAGVSYE